YLERKLNRGAKKSIRVRVYTTPGKKHQAKFALDVTVRTLEFYEKYFDIPYPLNTLDMIAIPDFQSFAMENWGAITFREIGLLVDEKNTSIGTKELIAEVIAHELAHQWFGNLVTMEWWTHLWLNEGFASYIPYLAISKLFPKWNIWERFNTQTLGAALRLDALANTHPIEIPVHHPDEIGEIFDEVSYSKGASIIRMLADHLGEKDFRDGLRYYLKKHSYKNTETIHLWQAFEKISQKPVAKIMHNWTSKPGYPVIKAEMIDGKIDLSQSRFFSSPASKKRARDKTLGRRPTGETKWEIPVILGKNKVNLGETGFFRTAYSKKLLDRLYTPVQKKTLDACDRLGIIRDLFALSEAGTIPTTDALSFLEAYKKE
ncbi:MAG: M1 family metallopeptidase, partial [Patescibacteria group bacterium]